MTSSVCWERMAGKTVMVTGATGLIGSALVRTLLSREENIRVAAPVRNAAKARALFAPELARGAALTIAEADVCRPLSWDGPVDFLIHGAGPTASRDFVEKPVEVIGTVLRGTENLLSLAREKAVESMVFLSTMEVYGQPASDSKVRETDYAYLDPLQVRSSYPESKRLAECLCVGYASEYGVPVKIVRLTQTFGPGVAYHDGRVFAEFARCVLEGRDIVLHTRGETRRSYLYTEDAVSAILTVLLHGADGEAYTAANEESYCSILEMAELAASLSPDGAVHVRVEADDDGSRGYAPVLRMNLDTSRLRSLGWAPGVSLEEMFRRMMAGMHP